MSLSETKNLPPLIGKLGRESQQSMSSPVPTGEEPFLLLLCSRHWGREPRQIHPDAAQVPAQKAPVEMPPGCRSQLTVLFRWPFAWPSGRERSVSQYSAPAFRGQRCQTVPTHSAAFPQLLTSRTELPCVSDKTGQGEGVICLLGKFPWSPVLLHGCSCPCKLYVSKKQVLFTFFLPFPSPAGFHSHRNATAPFACLYATETSDSSSKQLLLYSLYRSFIWIFWYVLILNYIRANDHLAGLLRILPFNPLIPIFLLQSKTSHFLWP